MLSISVLADRGERSNLPRTILSVMESFRALSKAASNFGFSSSVGHPLHSPLLTGGALGDCAVSADTASAAAHRMSALEAACAKRFLLMLISLFIFRA